MSLACRLVNQLLVWLFAGDAKAFEQALTQPEIIQKEILFNILEKNKNTEYGNKWGFSCISSVEEFQNKVPLTVYEDYLPYIDRIGEGKQQVLFTEPVRLFELTSGSLSASKRIPYTEGLKQEFQKGIRPWLHDLFTRYPELKKGRSYWSITPAGTEKQVTSGGIPIGFEEDAQYFGKLEQGLMNLIFVKPPEMPDIWDMDMFYFQTCLALLKARDLALISVWNPTYLFLLLDFMQEHSQRLTEKLPSRRRKLVREALERKRYEQIWPDLKIISCWCDGAAKTYRREMERLFPQAVVQPKGLLATEAFITFPWRGSEGGVLSLQSHFFEFRDMETGQFVPYGKLRKGNCYEVIVTTGGGLYRYCIGDMVEVCSHQNDSHDGTAVPVLRFVGRTGKISDRFGEKLNERFVQGILESLIPEGYFCMLAPEGNRYVLYLETGAEMGGKGKEGIKPDLELLLEQALCENFHYQYCRKLGQLLAAKVQTVYGNPREAFLKEGVSRGQKLGDIKLSALSLDSGWNRVFETEGQTGLEETW